MARPVKRVSLKKNRQRIRKGVIHVQASFNNTIVTVTNTQGKVMSWCSAGACGFKGAKKSTPFAAQIAAENAIRSLADQGLKQAEIMIHGPGLGRDTALRVIRDSGIVPSLVCDITSMAHNGCRSPKRRRI